jgi:hypothetical protein
MTKHNDKIDDDDMASLFHRVCKFKRLFETDVVAARVFVVMVLLLLLVLVVVMVSYCVKVLCAY